jgi:serine/threonine-protein kinase
MSERFRELPELHGGAVVDGKYRIDRVVGVGGMGVVVAGQHVGLGEKVALKVLHPSMLDNKEAVARFEREARTAAKIRNEHVARVTDVGALPSGAPYMVMEYLEGIDLGVWLQDREAMPVAQAVLVILQVCEALAEAHVLGVVHRDLKPANLFYVDRGDSFCVKILDFGISKIMEPEADQRLTTVHALMGSPLYMSPEQMQRKRGVDARSDIWSLGVILFELLTRRPPFEAGSVAELAVLIATERPPLLRSRLPDAPAALESAIARCLEKDREKRFQNVGDLALALAELTPQGQASVERVLAALRAIPGGAISSPALDTRPAPFLGTTTISPVLTTPPARGWGRAVVLTLAGVAVAGALASWGLRRSETSSASDGASAPAAVGAAEGSHDAGGVPSPASGLEASAPPALVASASAAPAPPTSASPSATRARGRPATIKGRSKATVDCDPSYYFDSHGKKHFKPECFAE